MPRNCFGDLGGVKNCWGYKVKLVRSEQDSTDTLLKNARIFSYKELQKATDNFRTIMGIGGFSSCYKGTLANGTVLVVKVLEHNSNHNQDSDFTSLINMMSILRHRNVAQFIGYCLEGDRSIIVSEFVGGYNLHHLLFSADIKEKQSCLSWPTRASICIGIARGLEYLHEGATHRVVHRDIKPSNILLDDNFNPKIVGFETGKLFDDDVSHYSDRICGTYGYIDPEYLLTSRYTEKADVYGFGILVLEVTTGRKFLEFRKDLGGVTLEDWVWELRETGKVLEIVDPSLSNFPEDEVKRFIDVALSCVQSSSNLRPSMSEVLLMLLGGYDFSKTELRNPKHSLWTSNYNEDFSPRDDEKEVTVTSPVHVHSRKHNSMARSTFQKAPREPVTESMSKATRSIETEIESDLDTHSSTSELMEISHDLETELYRSIEVNASDSPTISGTSNRITAKTELVRPSSKTSRMHKISSLSANIRTKKQVHMSQETKQVQMSQDLEDELQLNELSVSGFELGQTPAAETDTFVQKEAVDRIPNNTETSEIEEMLQDLEDEMQLGTLSLSEFHLGHTSVKTNVRATTSVEIDSYVQNEVIDRIPYQAETSEIQEVILLPEVDMNRPIQCTLVKVLEALKDHKRILLYGRGGSGKTTVLKHLLHHPATKELFDEVLFVTVPRFAYQKHMRDEIIRLMSLNVENNSCLEDEIISLICEALKFRKILVILDGVWESINLHDIGIPDPSPENSCWVVLATRFLDVCCAMADSEIEMEVLSEAETWALFCHQVGDIIESPKIKPYARAISKECYGSPVIIFAIGSALTSESRVEEWELALRNLQLGDTANANDQFSYRHCIKYCYNRLVEHDLKTGFLYTSLFQQDQEIDISMLVECFISEGLVGGTAVSAYKRGHYIVQHLINASLLEANDNGSLVRMHNVIRDSALEIFLSDVEGYQVLVRSFEPEKEEDRSFQVSHLQTMPSIRHLLTRAGAHLKDSPLMEEWEHATMIFLMDNEFSTLPSKPNCSTLLALHLQRNSSLRVIPASFFDSMSNLKILNLSKTRIKALPDSILMLRSLQILLLRDCERLLSLPPSIGLLKSLKVLDLQGTELTHLPSSVGELTSLNQLRVSFFGSVHHFEYKRLPSKLIPDGVLSILTLRELGIFVYPGDRRWTLSASSIIKEISCMRLSVFHFHFPNIEDLESFVQDGHSWKERNLTKFNFIVGPDFKRIVSLVSNDAELLYSEGQRCLRFVNGESIPNVVVEVLSQCTSFYLDHHFRISCLSQFGIHCFNGLKIFILRDCSELIEMVDFQEHGREVFPSLEYLSINYIWNLKRILGCHVGIRSFARLKCLSIHACPKLSYILTSSMVRMLENLEELIIEDCVSLKYVVIEDEDASSEALDMRKPAGVTACKFSVLCSLKVLKLHYLPEICGVWTAQWPQVEYISFYNCPRLKNLRMKGHDDVHIKEITTDRAWWDSLEWDDPLLSRRLHMRVTQIHSDDL